MYAKDYRNLAVSSLRGKWGNVYAKMLFCVVVGYLFEQLSSILYQAPQIDFTNLQPYLDYLGSYDFYMGRLLVLIGSVIVSGLAIAKVSVFLATAYRRTSSWDDFFANVKRIIESFILSLIIAVKVFLWSLLFIIPGIIKMFAYSMAIYIKTENPDMSYSEAIAKSQQMMDGNKWRLFCLYFSFIGWWILASLVISVASMIFIPLTPLINTGISLLVTIYLQCAAAHFYISLKRPEQTAQI